MGSMNSHLIISGMSFFSFAAWSHGLTEPEPVTCIYIHMYVYVHMCIYIYVRWAYNTVTYHMKDTQTKSNQVRSSSDDFEAQYAIIASLWPTNNIRKANQIQKLALLWLLYFSYQFLAKALSPSGSRANPAVHPSWCAFAHKGKASPRNQMCKKPCCEDVLSLNCTWLYFIT